MPLSPLVVPLSAKEQWEEQKQPVYRDEDRLPSVGQNWGTVRWQLYMKERTGLAPRALAMDLALC